ncbi:MAG: beta-lactamase family protein [Chitinophagales bacterium]|nr:beta-lactamase family protein [Chitinophagales bacterium]
MRLFTSLSILFLFVLLSSCATSRKLTKLEQIVPEEKGFSSQKLDSLGLFLEESGSSSLILLVDGKIIYQWGNTQKKHLVHSIRKALLNSLYGIYIANGTIDTSMTLEQLGIDDITPSLSSVEKTATIADLLKSRSGIYHPAAAVSDAMQRKMPARGAHHPNEVYYYNNWDFNALGYILEKQTGQSIYDLFYQHIAKPLGMSYANQYTSIYIEQDTLMIPNTDGFYQYESDKSKYPAYHFRLSAEDLALYGQLYLNKGKWKGKQIIPEEWIDISTKAYSTTYKPAGLGYGMLWKVLMKTDFRSFKSFYHTGLGIHMLAVYPATGMVLVHRVDTEHEHHFTETELRKVISLVWDTKKS